VFWRKLVNRQKKLFEETEQKRNELETLLSKQHAIMGLQDANDEESLKDEAQREAERHAAEMEAQRRRVEAEAAQRAAERAEAARRANDPETLLLATRDEVDQIALRAAPYRTQVVGAQRLGLRPARENFVR
jgi:hypothetical protein